MSEPVWIDCESLADVVSAEELARLATSGRHAVLRLRFPVSPNDKSMLIARLAVALPDHSVFDSGSDPACSCVTVFPVVPRTRVVERREEVVRAVEEYRRLSPLLAEQYRRGELSPEWLVADHGFHCRCENLRTGQVVEAALLERGGTDRVDPYFFAEFVQTTAGFESVADLITNKSHDGARILLVLAESHS